MPLKVVTPPTLILSVNKLAKRDVAEPSARKLVGLGIISEPILALIFSTSLAESPKVIAPLAERLVAATFVAEILVPVILVAVRLDAARFVNVPAAGVVPPMVELSIVIFVIAPPPIVASVMVVVVNVALPFAAIRVTPPS